MSQPKISGIGASWSAIAALIFFITVPLSAQNNSAPLPPRDQAALQLLSTALQKNGGQNIWQTLHGARVKGTLTTLSHSSSGTTTATRDIEWVDDWSTGRPRYTRSITTPSGTHVMRHSDGPTSTATLKGKQITVQQFDRTTVLLTHVPAAALAMILSDSRYAIQDDPRSSTANDTAVDVIKADRTAIQVWFISKTTGQVDAVRFAVPNPTKSAHLPWETAVYTHYRSESGLTRPDNVTLIRPTGQSIQLHFEHMESNPSVSANDFTQGGGK